MTIETPLSRRLQRQYVFGAFALLPISPFLYVQGQITRWKIGVLPEAGGGTSGTCKIAGSCSAEKLLVLGESTVAGLGARDHDHALAGRFAHYLSSAVNAPIEWAVVGRNGVTARRTMDELLPLVPDDDYGHILLGLGGNDVLKISSPNKWRRDMLELLKTLRERFANAKIYITNCPMIIESPVLPEPIKSLLWRLSQMHDANIREFSAGIENVFYYPQPKEIDEENFFADGIHPSETGYDRWARAMIEYFAEEYAPWTSNV